MRYSLGSIAAVALLAGTVALGSGSAMAGPFIIAGTDADDHGSATASANLDGWLFMQRALENLAPAVTNGNKTVVFLGSDVGTTAGDAAQSAFSLSGLVAQGWTASFINGAANIGTFLAGGASTMAGIIMLDSGDNVFGGLETTEEAALTANANNLNSFLGAGGGLFSQANSLGFLSTLLPALVQQVDQQQGLTLTPDGQSAFPGLTSADLSSGPYHKQFINTGSLPVLAVESNARGLAVVIGAAGGTITDPTPPTPVPEPASMMLFLAGLAGLGMVRRTSKAA